MTSECKGDAGVALVGAAGVGSSAKQERRCTTDRRRFSARTLVQGSLTPRRRGSRRAGESHALVDWHEPYLLFSAIMILLLSVTDAFMTLTLLMHGAEEANPILDYVLSNYPALFATVKMSLTGGGLIVLVVLARTRLFRVIRVSTILHWCLVGYVALIAYEWWLFEHAV